jgi:hypothetical protein
MKGCVELRLEARFWREKIIENVFETFVNYLMHLFDRFHRDTLKNNFNV